MHFVDGERDGLSTQWWANGEKQFEGSFEADRPVEIAGVLRTSIAEKTDTKKPGTRPGS